jgi:hypothetical protein
MSAGQSLGPVWALAGSLLDPDRIVLGEVGGDGAGRMRVVLIRECILVRNFVTFFGFGAHE